MSAHPAPEAPLGTALPCSPQRAFMSPPGGPQEPPEKGEGMRRRAPTDRAERANVASTAAKLAALTRMTGPELAAQYESLFGAHPRSRNRQYLRKRLAYRIQELAEGGLSQRAIDRIEELIRLAPPPWRQGKPGEPASRGGTSARPSSATRAGRSQHPGLPASGAGDQRPSLVPTRDPRLPAPGTVLTRSHGGAEHRVTVLADGFEYRGERHRSLSRIARLITGTPWNGYLFFFGRSGGTRKPSERAGA